MMNYDYAQENSALIDQNMIFQSGYLPHTMSFIPKTDMGDVLYEWIEARVENMSSIKLAEILYRNELDSLVNSCFAHAARQELIRRGHYESSRSWKFVGL